MLRKACLGWISAIYHPNLKDTYVQCKSWQYLLSGMEAHILKTSTSDKCRICGKEPESTWHLLAGCDVLAKKEYLDRHNQVARYIHHSICKSFNFPTEKKWHLHKPADVAIDQNEL